MKKYRHLLACFILAGIAGCSTPPPMPEFKMSMGIPDGKVEYEPVSPQGLSLKMISKPTVYAGEKTALSFAVSNDSHVTVSIPEWYTHEPDNVIIYVQPWLTGMTAPAEDAWIELSFDLKKPVLHYPLTLMPGNQVLVTKELPFIQMLQVSEGKMRRYFVKATLNLKSLKLDTGVFHLQVLPKQKSGEK